jgi:ABC-2 type transport system ATP-binding protein
MIKLENVRKSFRKTKVLKGIDLLIGSGDRIALVGSNGAGKTTMIRCLLGEYTYQGTVLFNEMVPRDNRTEVLKQIGFVPQLSPPLKMTVGRLVKFVSTICECPSKPIIEIVEKLGLDYSEFGKRQFVKLSGGEKQKVLIALALGRPTSLLVMDEPTANLDPRARQVFFNLLAERIKDISMIISSHRLDEVSSLVNRVVEMDRGKIILDDHVEDTSDLTTVLGCTVKLHKPNDAFSAAIKDWEFSSDSSALVWNGKVAGPDRLRFLGMLSRYSGLLAGLDMKE